MLGKLICWLKRSHRWSRPHKGEVENFRYCRRCGAERPVRKRKAKSEAGA